MRRSTKLVLESFDCNVRWRLYSRNVSCTLN